VAQLASDETEVRGVIDGVVVVYRMRVFANGAKLGGEFRCQPSSLPWLIGQLEAVASERASEAAHDAPPDHLEVFARGGDHGEDININININVLNTCDGERSYSLGAMTPEVAQRLASELRTL
jgi:hypothetical protein